MMKDQHLPQVAKPEVDAWQDGLQCVPDKNNLPEAYHPELGLDERIATPKSRNASIRRNHLVGLPKATIRLRLGLFMTATLAIVAADIIGSLLHEGYFELSQAQPSTVQGPSVNVLMIAFICQATALNCG